MKENNERIVRLCPDRNAVRKRQQTRDAPGRQFKRRVSVLALQFLLPPHQDEPQARLRYRVIYNPWY